MAFLDLIHWVFVKETAIGEVPALCHVLPFWTLARLAGPFRAYSSDSAKTTRKTKINRKKSFDVDGDAERLPMIDTWPFPPPRVATKFHLYKEQMTSTVTQPIQKRRSCTSYQAKGRPRANFN
jgi:hypothetical protein